MLGTEAPVPIYRTAMEISCSFYEVSRSCNVRGDAFCLREILFDTACYEEMFKYAINV